MKKLNDNVLSRRNNRQVVILDSDEEEESAKQIGTSKASGDDMEDLKITFPSSSHLNEPQSLDSDQGNGPITYAHATFDEVRRDKPGKSMHVIAESVQCTVRDARLRASYDNGELAFKKPIQETAAKDFATHNQTHGKARKRKVATNEDKTSIAEPESKKDEGLYVGVHDASSNHQTFSDDGLGEIWTEMTVALECYKDPIEDVTNHNEDEEEECDHFFLLKEDIGSVCRVCGVISKSIEKIFEYQWGKVSRSTRTYAYESRSIKEREENDAPLFCGSTVSQSGDHALSDVSVHPRHMKEMKLHQLEGFNFLVRNLLSDNPGGCILAHAPGSGKTFMIVSFIQSFRAKHQNARPLVVLPKGILGTWKREFIKWQVDDVPLFDFYSRKAERREEQLDVLKEWHEKNGVLFLGYTQFANIICKNEGKANAACQELLLNSPQILILDEGHNPRNKDTDMLNSLKKVKTPRKVVLSGTLFQNHVNEVFNILELVRPNFLKSDTSKTIKRRIMNRGVILRKQDLGSDEAFFEVVEETLKDDENYSRKVAVIQDLREMTKNVLHYYKGDFLDELHGLVDFTVHLNLTPEQRDIVESLKNLDHFTRNSIGSSVYLHPKLEEISETDNISVEKIDSLVAKINVRDGVKANFFLNILGLCESSGEKLLVFSQYRPPLRFLERLVANIKGWSVGKEVFVIHGDTSPDKRESSMERFNNSTDAKVFFGSIKACGEGISLVGASRVLIMDVHVNPSVTRQAIGRAFRPGQLRKVFVYRLVASDSPEEENHTTSLRKELISKMWFEWSEFSGNSKFAMETVNLKDNDDRFWESPSLREDVNVVKRR
ncbi:hypothetical protein ACHQM5_015433 [Ranunculus cassubicifolius]